MQHLPSGFSFALISGLARPEFCYTPFSQEDKVKTVTAHYTAGLLDHVDWCGYSDRLGNPVDISLEISKDFHENVATQKLDLNAMFPYHKKCLHVDDPRNPAEFMELAYKDLDEVLSLEGLRPYWNILCSLGPGFVKLQTQNYPGPVDKSSIRFFLGDHQSVLTTVFTNDVNDTEQPKIITLTHLTWTTEELLDAPWIRSEEDGQAE